MTVLAIYALPCPAGFQTVSPGTDQGRWCALLNQRLGLGRPQSNLTAPTEFSNQLTTGVLWTELLVLQSPTRWAEPLAHFTAWHVQHVLCQGSFGLMTCLDDAHVHRGMCRFMTIISGSSSLLHRVFGQ